MRSLPAVLDRFQATVDGARPSIGVDGVHVARGGRVLVELAPIDGLSAVVKLGREPSHRLSLRRQARVLRLIHCHPGLNRLSPMVPRPLLSGNEGEWTFLIESRLAGRRAVARAEGGASMLEVMSLIKLLHQGTASQHTIGDRQLQRWVGRRVRVVSELAAGRVGADEVELLALVEVDLTRELRGRSAEIGWIHGDYWPGNLLTSDDGRISGVVDWDSVRGGELPLHDMLHYLCSARRLRQGQPWGFAVRDLLGQQPSSMEGDDTLDRALAGAPWLNMRAALLLYWLQVIESSLRRHPLKTSMPAWIDRNIRPVLEVLA